MSAVRYSLRIIGRFAIFCGDECLGLPTWQKARLLLVRLAWEGALSREIARLWLWPDTDDVQGATNLRRLLHFLRTRHAWCAKALSLGDQELRVAHDVEWTIDAKEMLSSNVIPLDHPGWRAPVLPGFDDPWTQSVRRLVRDRLVQAARTLLDERPDEQTVAVLEGLVANHPTDEELSFLLAQAYHLAGKIPLLWSERQRLRSALAKEGGRKPTVTYETRMASLLLDSTAIKPTAPFVGRAAEKATLVQSMAAAQDMGPMVVWLEGEAGIGKSRLVQEALREFDWADSPYLILRCVSHERSVPYAPLVRALRAMDLTEVEDPWRSELGRILPELGVAGPRRPLTNAWQKARLHYAVSRTLLRPRPRAIIIEDIQWMDRATGEWVASLLDLPWSRKMVLVLTARTEEEAPPPTLLNRLLESLPGKHLRLLQLGPLTADAIVACAEQMLGRKLAAEEQGAIIQLSRGNPHDLLAILDTSKDEVAWSPWRSALRLRLQAMSPNARRFLELLAFLGEVRQDFIEDLPLSMDRGALFAILGELDAAGIVTIDERGVVAFAHDKLREHIIQDVHPRRARGLHTAAAVFLAQRATDGETHLRVARHFAAARLLQRASFHYEQAWHLAEERGHVPLILAALEEAIPLADPDSARTMQCRQAAWLLRSGLPQQALGLARNVLEATDIDVDPVARLTAASLVLQSLTRLGRVEEARHLLVRELTVNREQGRHEAALSLLAEGAGMFYQAGELREAYALGRELLNRAATLGFLARQAEALNLIGLIDSDQGRYEQALTHFERALDLVQEHDREAILTLLGNLGNAYINLGRYHEAYDRIMRRLRLAKAWGFRDRERLALGNLASLFGTIGMFREAASVSENVVREAAPTGDIESVHWALSEAGRATYHMGAEKDGIEFIDAAIRYAERADAKATLARHQLRASALRLVSGRAKAAVRMAESCERRARQSLRPTVAVRARLVRLAALVHLGEITMQTLNRELTSLESSDGWLERYAVFGQLIKYRLLKDEATRRSLASQVRSCYKTEPSFVLRQIHMELTGQDLPAFQLPLDPALPAPFSGDAREMRGLLLLTQQLLGVR